MTPMNQDKVIPSPKTSSSSSSRTPPPGNFSHHSYRPDHASYSHLTPIFQEVELSESQLSAGVDSLEPSQASQLISTQIESLTQMEYTQQSQIDEAQTPLSPPAPLPWARLVPCMPSIDNPPVDLLPGTSEYWLGRSSVRSKVHVKPGSSLEPRENNLLEWAHSTISNRHCKITQLHNTIPALSSSSFSSRSERDNQATPSPPQIILEDNSGNGTFVNQTVHLKKGHQRILHSGDEICLVNPNTIRKQVKSARVIRNVLQRYSYVFVLSNKPKRPCVNPRAMNYAGSYPVVERGVASPRSARRIEAHYDIREVLGDGTSGQVRRVIHRQSGQEYAVKVISLRRQLDLTSMEHEVTMMQSLDHPYIVQLVDVFVHPGIAMYLVMELVAGGDLFDRIVQQERYTEVDARRVMRRLLSAVHYLHQTKNIVHRDLKPENILCASPIDVKLADFGLAKIIQADGLKTFCGTPQYFAPEVLQRRTTVAGSGRYGKPADIWSLGVILYILLTGRPPFEFDLDPMQAFDTIDFDDPVWKGMPQAQELVQQMLRLDPKRRITVCEACDHPWINTEDGDSHVHPLDDPAVTGRKRLFSESAPEEALLEEQRQPCEGHDVKVSSASAKLHKRSSSDVSNATMAREEEEGETTDVSAAGTTTFSRSGSVGMESDGTVDDSNMVPVKADNEKCNEKYYREPTESSSEEHAFATNSPDQGIDALMTRELSVTPSECGDDGIPRSPLAAMSLNDRSNRVRAQVLEKQREKIDDSPPSRSPCGSNQVAVTPTASNVRPSKTSKDRNETDTNEAADEEVDPILSQFSSEPSSLGSFPDSPDKAAPAVVCNKTESKSGGEKQRHLQQKKRKRMDEGDDDRTLDTSKLQDAKSHKTKHVVQTKLSAWFVPKKPKVDVDTN